VFDPRAPAAYTNVDAITSMCVLLKAMCSHEETAIRLLWNRKLAEALAVGLRLPGRTPSDGFLPV